MHPNRRQLTGYLLGTLPEEDAQAVSHHLSECDACEATINQLDGVADTVIAKLRGGPPRDPFAEESSCHAMVSAIKAMADESFCAAGGFARAIESSVPLAPVGHYRLLSRLGEGGMGTVYKALHVKLDKLVALKILSASRMMDAAAVSRFEREMKAVGKLSHPNIVAAHDAGEYEGTHYLVMELVEGIDLSRLVRRVGPLRVNDACELIRQAALGLRHAHEQGLVHRDIKPSNVMLARGPDDQPQVKILDMGLALLHQPFDRDDELTTSGQLMGTIDYMAPEQAMDSHDVDTMADIYSLGATLYKLLCGVAPFPRVNYATPLKQAMAVATQPAPPVARTRPECPAALAAVVDRMLAKDPLERFATAADVAEALTPFATGHNLSALLQLAAAGDDPQVRVEQSIEGTQDQLTSPSAETVEKPKLAAPRRTRWPVVAASLAAVGVIVILGAILLTLRTRYGEVVIELGEGVTAKDVRVEVKGTGDLRVADAQHGWTIEVREGRYDVSLAGGNDRLTLSKEQIVVERNQKSHVVVTLKPLAELRALDPDRESAGPPFHQLQRENPDREVAKWVASVGGWMEVVVDGEHIEFGTVDTMPAEEFYIHRINLHGNQNVKDADFKRLAGLKGLRSLEINKTPITDEALRRIAQVKSITVVHAYGTRISDDGLAHLAKLRRLGYLNVDDTAITDDGLAHLKGLPGLGHLAIARTAVTSAGLAHIAEMKFLGTIYLDRTAIDDDGLVHVAQLPRLRVLKLSQTKVGDEGLEHLQAAKGLEWLDLQQTRVSAAGVAELKQALPQCEVLFNQDDGETNRADR